jgi:hypothetical protein
MLTKFSQIEKKERFTMNQVKKDFREVAVCLKEQISSICLEEAVAVVDHKALRKANQFNMLLK